VIQKSGLMEEVQGPTAAATFWHRESVLTAEKVDEEEERKHLWEAVELVCHQVLQNLHKKTFLFLGLFLLVIIIVIVTVIAISLKDENSTPTNLTDPLPTSLQPQKNSSLMTATTIIPANSLFPTMAPSSSLTMVPSISPTECPDNFFCSDSYPVHLDGSIWNGSLVDQEADDSNWMEFDSYVACSHSLDSSLQVVDPVYWYRLQGNGLVVAARLCRDSSYAMLVFSSCNNEMNLAGDCAFYWRMLFAQDCATYWWETVIDKDFYILIGTPEQTPVGNYSFMLSSNDYCSNAYKIAADSTRRLTLMEYATTESLNTSCGILKDNDVWYSINGTGQTLIFNACMNTEIKSQVSVFTGECENLQCITAGNMLRGIGECQYQSSTSWLSVLDEMYIIHVSTVQNGSFFVILSATESYDICDGAKLLSLEALAVYTGLTAEATNTGDAKYFVDEGTPGVKLNCNDPLSQPYSKSAGVWYKMMGSNVAVSADSCSNSTGFQPVISVLEGSCQKEDLKCASSTIYNSCSDSGVGTKVSWYVEANKTYYIFVFGKEKAEKGDFTLNVTIYARRVLA